MKNCNGPVLPHRGPGVDTGMYSLLNINLVVCSACWKLCRCANPLVREVRQPVRGRR